MPSFELHLSYQVSYLINMKQIEIIKTYSQKRCLIVDDVPEVRTSLNRVLTDFGSNRVDTAGSAEEAIEICDRHQYDIVLADYNLGPGKNGQQLLEELRFHNLLLKSSLFIMITAENASHYVLHTLENQPDDYVNKPITKDSLRARLDQALLKNEALMPIKKALDLNKINTAISSCQALLDNNTKYKNDVKKIYGELLIKQSRFAEAQLVYSSTGADKRPLWAEIGIALTHILTKSYDEAESVLNALLSQNQYCVEAHDLLAQIYQEKDNLTRAQHQLSMAVQISPRSISRQRAMGKVSCLAGDRKASVRAYRAALKQSKGSCHETPEDYLSLAQGLIDYTEEKPEMLNQVSDELSETLKQLEKKYSSHPILTMRGKQLEADFFDLKGSKDLANKRTESALQIHSEIKYSVISNTPINISIACAKAFMDRGKYDEGEKLLQELSKVNDDPDLAIKIDKLLRDPVTKEGVLFAARQNKVGISLYQNKEYQRAQAAFEKVLCDLPNHIGLNLNLIQAIVSRSKEENLSQHEHKLLENSFQRIGAIDGQSKYSERFLYLKKQSEKIISDQC